MERQVETTCGILGLCKQNVQPAADCDQFANASVGARHEYVLRKRFFDIVGHPCRRWCSGQQDHRKRKKEVTDTFSHRESPKKVEGIRQPGDPHGERCRP